MRVHDVSIRKGMTLNLGNHTFSKVEIEISATLDDQDSFVEDLDNLTNLVNAKLAQEVNKVLPAKSAKTSKPKRQTLMEQRMGAGETV